MADNSLRSTPVDAAGGFAGRGRDQTPPRPQVRQQPAPSRGEDRVQLLQGTAVALRLLRERVLAATRVLLELGDEAHGPAFAEDLDHEPVAAFVGRLLSAQNHLAAPRAASWPPARLRQTLDAALRCGAAETAELLAADMGAEAAAAVVAQVIAEYDRRLAILEAEPDSGPTPAS